MPNPHKIVETASQWPIAAAPGAMFFPCLIVAPTIVPEFWADIGMLKLPLQCAVSTAACELRVLTAHRAFARTTFEIPLITVKVEAVAARQCHDPAFPTISQ